MQAWATGVEFDVEKPQPVVEIREEIRAILRLDPSLEITRGSYYEILEELGYGPDPTDSFLFGFDARHWKMNGADLDRYSTDFDHPRRDGWQIYLVFTRLRPWANSATHNNDVMAIDSSGFNFATLSSMALPKEWVGSIFNHDPIEDMEAFETQSSVDEQAELASTIRKALDPIIVLALAGPSPFPSALQAIYDIMMEVVYRIQTAPGMLQRASERKLNVAIDTMLSTLAAQPNFIYLPCFLQDVLGLMSMVCTCAPISAKGINGQHLATILSALRDRMVAKGMSYDDNFRQSQGVWVRASELLVKLGGALGGDTAAIARPLLPVLLEAVGHFRHDPFTGCIAMRAMADIYPLQRQWRRGDRSQAGQPKRLDGANLVCASVRR